MSGARKENSTKSRSIKFHASRKEFGMQAGRVSRNQVRRKANTRIKASGNGKGRRGRKMKDLKLRPDGCQVWGVKIDGGRQSDWLTAASDYVTDCIKLAKDSGRRITYDS